MFTSSLRVLFQHGTQYIKRLDKVELCDKFRGRPVLHEDGLNDGQKEELKAFCPTGAIETTPVLSIDLGRCLFCGECARKHPDNIRFTNDYRIASPTREGLIVKAGADEALPFDQSAVRPEIKKTFGKALHLRQVSAGGDNSCEMELNASGNVNFDLRRYGIEFTASPRHADGIVITGPLTVNMMRETEITLQAVPEPRIIIAVGCDAISGGLFADSPATDRSFFDKYKVDLYVPGNPAHPMTFISGVRQLLKAHHSATARTETSKEKEATSATPSTTEQKENTAPSDPKDE